MTDAVYACNGCATTAGRAGCATHRDRSGTALFSIIYCQHGLDLRLNPRCYLCRPETPPCRLCGGNATMHVCSDTVQPGGTTA